MSIFNVFEQVIGNSSGGVLGNQQTKDEGNRQQSKSNNGGLAGGLLGGVVAGGLISTLVSSKSSRKFAGTAAKYGGAALLGGAAYKMYKNWQHGQQSTETNVKSDIQVEPQLRQKMSHNYQLTVVKAMIAAARVDGHIDNEEQGKIFQAVAKMDLSSEDKGRIFDLLNQPISVEEIAPGVETMEQKAEVYFASCLVIDPNGAAEREHLNRLSSALGLPKELTCEIEQNSHQGLLTSA